MAHPHLLSVARISPQSRAVGRLALVVCLTATLALGTPRLAPAGLGSGSIVFDPSVYGQAVIQVSETIRSVQLSIQDLASFTQIGTALQVVAQLRSVMAQVEGISQRIQSRRELWKTSPTFTGMRQLAAWRNGATALCQTVTVDALDSQSLLGDGARLLNTLSTLMDTIGALSGSVAGLQAATTAIGGLSGQLAGLQALAAVNNESGLCQSWQKGIRRQGLTQVQQHMFRDYGTILER